MNLLQLAFLIFASILILAILIRLVRRRPIFKLEPDLVGIFTLFVTAMGFAYVIMPSLWFGVDYVRNHDASQGDSISQHFYPDTNLDALVASLIIGAIGSLLVGLYALWHTVLPNDEDSDDSP